MTHQSQKTHCKPILILAGSLLLMVFMVCFAVSQADSSADAADPPAKNKRDKPKKKTTEKSIRQKTPVEIFMRSKLQDNSTILEGIMTNDFAPIVEAAEHLKLMSTATQWHVIQGPIYKQHSNEFRRATERLKIDAQKKNLDAVALDYMHMTMACVSCHKFVRGTQIADGNVPPLKIPKLQISQRDLKSQDPAPPTTTLGK